MVLFFFLALVCLLLSYLGSWSTLHIACEMDLLPCTCCLQKLTVDAFLKDPEDLTSKVLKTCRHCREKRVKAYHAKKDQGRKRQFGDELDANTRPGKRSKRIDMESEFFLGTAV
jgi:hypothetical protein